MSQNVYKVGGCLYIHETGADLDVIDFPTPNYSGFKTEGTDVIIYNHIVSSVDLSKTGQSKEHFEGVRIAIADVRNNVGAVIGDGGKAAIRDYLAGLL